MNLNDVIRTGSEDKIIAALQSLGKSDWKSVPISTIRDLAWMTPSANIRNAAALALADMRAPHAQELLIKLLRRPDTKGWRGTLLYALEIIRASVPLDLLISVIAEDSYEARQEALEIIANSEYDAGEVREGIARLKALPHYSDESVQAAVKEAEYLLAS